MIELRKMNNERFLLNHNHIECIELIPESKIVMMNHDYYIVRDTVEEIIEKIDIGGISLIRAGGKNFKDVVIIPSKAEYPVLLQILNTKGAQTDLEDRRMFAERAFGVSSHYDTAIHNWFAAG